MEANECRWCQRGTAGDTSRGIPVSVGGQWCQRIHGFLDQHSLQSTEDDFSRFGGCSSTVARRLLPMFPSMLIQQEPGPRAVFVGGQDNKATLWLPGLLVLLKIWGGLQRVPSALWSSQTITSLSRTHVKGWVHSEAIKNRNRALGEVSRWCCNTWTRHSFNPSSFFIQFLYSNTGGFSGFDLNKCNLCLGCIHLLPKKATGDPQIDFNSPSRKGRRKMYFRGWFGAAARQHSSFHSL